MLIILFIDGNFDKYLGKSISSDMEIDHMSSSGFDMSVIWEFDVFFFEFDIEFFNYSGTDSMFIESTEYFFPFSFE